MEYQERTYRERLKKGRWQHFIAAYKETDLWIGVDPTPRLKEMQEFAVNEIITLRKAMDAYLQTDKGYATSLVPYHAKEYAPRIFHQMSEAGEKSGIGPMSAVAGAVARHVALALQANFNIQEIMIENGGDIYADIQEDIDISVFAGQSPLSEKVGLHIEAKETPLGICTSSGTVGPSLSFGKADAVMIICKDVLLADSYATAFANRIQTAEDVDTCITAIGQTEEIIAAIAIKEDKMGVVGKFKLKIF